MRKVRLIQHTTNDMTGIVLGERNGKYFVIWDGDDANESHAGWFDGSFLSFS